MADYLCQEILTIGALHPVIRRKATRRPIATGKMERVSGSVASPRLDSVIAMVFSSSRTKILPLIEGEKVFIDGKQVTSRRQLKRVRLYLVRGTLGKFRALPGAGIVAKRTSVCLCG